MTPEMIRQLPARYALIIRGGMSPVIARLPMAWNDPAYKRARRSGHAIAVLTPVAEPATLSGDRAPATRALATDGTPTSTPSRRRHLGRPDRLSRGSKETTRGDQPRAR